MRPAPARILCVDDYADTGEMLTALLSQDGSFVRTVSSGIEALRLAAAAPFDLYVLDLRLPDYDGHDLCRELCVRQPDASIVFYSGAGAEHNRQHGLAAGARAFVVKPYIDELLLVVRSLLAARRDPAV